MPETLDQSQARNDRGRLYVAIGLLLMLASISDDAGKATSWGALLTPHEVFGLLGHATGSALMYLGARKQDP